MQMEKEDRIPHALLMCGPAGCGKMALAIDGDLFKAILRFPTVV